MLARAESHTPITTADLSSQNMQKHSQNSTISNLSPQKAQQHQRAFMNEAIQNAANIPSSSNNKHLNSLVALKNRNFQNAPGSRLSLSSTNGLLGGDYHRTITIPGKGTVEVVGVSRGYLAYVQKEGRSDSNCYGPYFTPYQAEAAGIRILNSM